MADDAGRRRLGRGPVARSGDEDQGDRGEPGRRLGVVEHLAATPPAGADTVADPEKRRRLGRGRAT